MKVLWFANTACSAAEILRAESHRGGWLKSLEQELVGMAGIELCICFYSSADIKPFVHRRTAYQPIYRKNTRSKLSRYFKRLSGKTGDDSAELDRLLKVVETVKPDIIHIHGTEDNFGLIQSKTNIPVVISIQGIMAPYSAKYFSGISAAVARKHESAREKMNMKSAYFLHRAMRSKVEREAVILRQSKYLIGRTNWDRRVTRVLAPASEYFHNDEILRTPFYGNSWKKERFTETVSIVTISSEALYKGFETVVETAMLLCKAGFAFNWRVVGLHAASGIVKLVRSAVTADLASVNVTLEGSKSEQDILQILASADLYCQVSHIENSPNSLCEAMLTGMPIVATNAGGTASLLSDGIDGILVQDGDAYAMAGSILELAGDFPRAAAYGASARQRALARHDRQRITADLVDIYQRIVQQQEVRKPMMKVLSGGYH